MRILFAEDDSLTRYLLQQVLCRWGYEVVLARDGDEAWRILGEPNPPSLIVLDWMMPGLSGPEICRKLRREAGHPFSYILLLTAMSDPADVIAGLDAGADDYLFKPFRFAELQARLRTGCRIIEQHAELSAAYQTLKSQSTQDELTGLWNRTAIREFLDQELRRSNRSGTSVGVIMIDVDHFKEVNDTWGHAVGDLVLSAVASRMRAELRTYDRIGRYGGEEFLIVLPDCSDQHVAVQVAERLRTGVCESSVVTPNGTLSVSISLGVTMYYPGQWREAELLVHTADQALYRAKSGGRNRSIVMPCEAPTTEPMKIYSCETGSSGLETDLGVA